MEYLDLTPYTYTDSALPMTSIGWLGSEHGVQGPAGAPLAGTELEELRGASRRICNVALGFHTCEFCGTVEGNGEYRYYLPDERTYAAPAMILHYVDTHAYRPPRQFLEGLGAAARPRWDRRADFLRAVLLDRTADLIWRAEAAVDLSQWDDRRAFDALRQVLADDLLIDCGGDEIGRSLIAFAERDYAAGLDWDALPPMVLDGIAHPGDDLHFVRPVGPDA
ncbi:DUF7919 family protein [Catenuloplanes indicus]|uniref:DUF7919 domain-containing protein n=1 Tax=Catenuloplanes indicus TaxID=137267 RepID=A0AAE3VU64_9ACTN|nr:hypothetical protein [Catenuloplanes indicus]MDQ0363725.1 hypothetical protein [Catenuloplanes indicus]